jgi:hexosaminidase
MPRLYTLFKTLLILSTTSFSCIFYLLLRNRSSTFLIDENYFHYVDRSNSFSLQNHTTLISKNIKIIPMPHFVAAEKSTLFLLLSDGFRIISNEETTPDLESAILRYTKYISLLTGISKDTSQNLSTVRNTLTITCPSIIFKENKYPKLGEDESYTLKIRKKGSYISSSSFTGIIRGLSTFVQLIERDTSSKRYYVPFVSIIDRPRFVWRGLMLDVARHWMPVSVIERTLNAMELSKLNVLHLHLSDDQGFRVESIQFPLLHDKTSFFTQKDIRYLIEYARQRRIRIVPEFDIPAHTTR